MLEKARDRLMKTCCTCKQEKPEEEFYKHKRTGTQGKCIPCHRAYYKMWVAKKTAELGHTPYRHKSREYHLRHHYGLKPEDVPKACQVCGSDKKICVDHDHETGKIRGFLCDACNVALGKAEDSPDRLRKLADYLERANG